MVSDVSPGDCHQICTGVNRCYSVLVTASHIGSLLSGVGGDDGEERPVWLADGVEEEKREALPPGV